MTQPRHPEDPPYDDEESSIELDEPATPEAEPSDEDLFEPTSTTGEARKTGEAPTAGARTRTPVASDELPYVDDRVSKIFVGAMVAVFVGIFAYALLFGSAGLLTPDATLRPSRAPSPSVSPAVSPSGSPAASPSGSPSVGTSPSGSPSGSPGESPSAAPTGGASPTGSASPAPTGSPASGSPSPSGS